MITIEYSTVKKSLAPFELHGLFEQHDDDERNDEKRCEIYFAAPKPKLQSLQQNLWYLRVLAVAFCRSFGKGPSKYVKHLEVHSLEE